MKMNNTEFTKAFNETYKMVATTGIYSMELANTMDDFGAPTGEANEEDKPTGDGGAGMGMSIMDGYNNKLGLSM